MNIEKIKSKKSISELLEFGIINIDKPSNPTSFDISNFVCKKLGLRKTSHFGTLDPKVTGVLPIALNRACKLTGFFLGENKEYIGIMKIHEDVSLDKIKKIINEKFTGKIMQKPPVKSRVKREEREREIINFELLEKKEKNILFQTEVQGGTYIRKLIDDLGKELGIGAHMLELRRIKAGIFKEENNVNLYDFEKAVDEYKEGNEEKLREMIIPGEIVAELYPSINVKTDIIDRLFHGSPLFNKDIENKDKVNDKICVFSGDKFIGIYLVVNKEDIFAKPEFVLQPIK
ncbi:MAG: RNA-guided pseudouridylation complex pseudouridine synthase subunit Cbf5 [Nanoarchaeota archaeon]